MTSSNDWDPGSPGSPTHEEHTATRTDPLDTSSTPAPDRNEGGKKRAQQAAETAKEEGAHVAETARSEAQQVVGEAKDKAAGLLGDARSQIDQQSKSQMQALATKLEELSGEVDSMVAGSDVQGTVTELARQLSDKTRAMSSRLNEREPKDLLDDVRGFARQRPGTFLTGALAAGVLAGRLTRGAKKAHDTDSAGSTTPATAGDLSSGSALGENPPVSAAQTTGGRL